MKYKKIIPKNIIKIILGTIIVIFFIGCSKKEVVLKGVIGEFAITNLKFENKSLLRNLSLNIIEFHKDGRVIIPKIIDRHHNGVIGDENIEGNWKLVLVGEKFQIEIATKNIYFNNKFDLSFSKTDENNILINLKNATLSLTAEKSFFNYSSNKTFVSNLIKFTK